jgi:hypothetical protein
MAGRLIASSQQVLLSCGCSRANTIRCPAEQAATTNVSNSSDSEVLGVVAVGFPIDGDVVRPDFGANWQIPAQVQFMFPKDLL